jgi:hypothetical protein
MEATMTKPTSTKTSSATSHARTAQRHESPTAVKFRITTATTAGAEKYNATAHRLATSTSTGNAPLRLEKKNDHMSSATANQKMAALPT